MTMWLLVPFPSLKRTKGKSRNKTSESPFVPKQRLSKDQDKQCFAFILSLACSLNNRILFYITIKLSSENRPGLPSGALSPDLSIPTDSALCRLLGFHFSALSSMGLNYGTFFFHELFSVLAFIRSFFLSHLSELQI